MTVTLSIEELQRHEQRMSAWGDARVEAHIKFYQDSLDRIAGPHTASELKALMDSWDALNPKPKLIPSV